MSEVIYSERFNAPISVVFEAFSDFSGAADRIEGIVAVEMLTDGPVGLGTRFKETRIIFGREATEEMEVTEFGMNEKLTVSANSCGSHFKTMFRFQAAGDQTDVNVEMHIQPLTWLAKLMWPIGFLMKGTMTKMIIADFDQTKAWCENPV